MSVLPPEIHSALGALLQGLQSPDNSVRAQAEEQLNNEWIVARADVLLMGLVEQIQGAQEAGVPTAPSISQLPLIKYSPAPIVCSRSFPPHCYQNSESSWIGRVQRLIQHTTTPAQRGYTAEVARMSTKRDFASRQTQNR